MLYIAIKEKKSRDIIRELVDGGAKIHTFRQSPFMLCVSRAKEGSQDSMDLIYELI